MPVRRVLGCCHPDGRRAALLDDRFPGDARSAPADKSPLFVWSVTVAVKKGAGNSSTPGTLRVLLASTVVLGLFLPKNLSRGVTGDEPYYLLVTHSLAFDADLDLSNNLRDRDFSSFYARDLATEGAVVTSDGGRSYAVHEVGFPLLLALPYRLGGKPLALLALYPIGILLALNVYWLAWEQTASVELAWRSWASVFTTAPVLLYTFQFYPEIISATIVVYSIRAIDRAFCAVWKDFLFGALVGSLPWLHPRYAILAGILAGSFVMCARPRRRAIAFVAPFALAVTANVAYDSVLFGWPFQRKGYDPFDFGTQAVIGLAGLLWDGDAGLLIGAPIYLLALPGLLLYDRHSSRSRIVLALVSAAYLLAGLYPEWHGGDCPRPARFLVSILPLLGVPIARVWTNSRGPWRWLCRALCVVSMVLPVVYVISPVRTYTAVPIRLIPKEAAIKFATLLPILANKHVWVDPTEPTHFAPLPFWILGSALIAFGLYRHLKATANATGGSTHLRGDGEGHLRGQELARSTR
jgi:hypothetical protein